MHQHAPNTKMHPMHHVEDADVDVDVDVGVGGVVGHHSSNHNSSINISNCSMMASTSTNITV